MTVETVIDLDSTLESYVVADTALASGDYEFSDTNTPFDFEILSVDADETRAETVQTPVESDDKSTTYTIAAHTRKNKQLSVSKINGVRGYGRPAWASDASAVAPIGSNGKLLHQSGGDVTVTATCNGISHTKDFTLPSISVSNMLVSGITGSARKAASDAIDSRITDGTNKDIFSTRVVTDPPTHIRNTNCWAADVDLTPISPWNTAQLNRGVTLISPQHIICANHNHVGVGAMARFIATDNTVVEREVVSGSRVSTTDIWIGKLASDVPSSISFAKVLPQDFAVYFPTDRYIPVFATDQEDKALVFESAYLQTTDFGIEVTKVLYPVDTLRYLYYELVITGDSGHAICMIIGGKLVLLSCWKSSQGGPSVAAYHAEVNSVMTSLGGGYQLTDYDLSSYTEFS